MAYNAAFEELGLDIYWNVATYCKLLEVPGGIRRLEHVLGTEWPVGLADEVHLRKEKHFERLAARGLELRPGVAEAIEYCERNAIRLAWVTTTTPAMIETLLQHTPALSGSCFELITTKADVGQEKPDPAIYDHALGVMDLAAEDVIAIEDTPVNQAAALSADLHCYLFPGEYAAVQNNILVTRDLRATIEHAHTLWNTEGDIAA